MQKTCKVHGELKIEDIQVEKNTYKIQDGTKKVAERLRCRICRREKDIKYKHDHRDIRLEYNKKWKEENRDRVNEIAKKNRLLNPEKHRKWAADYRERKGSLRNLEESLRRFKLDINIYNEMLINQNNVCKICKKSETRKSRTGNEITRLAIDHCHTTGQVRGLLCHECNTGIGRFKDDISLLEAAIEYLKSYS